MLQNRLAFLEGGLGGMVSKWSSVEDLSVGRYFSCVRSCSVNYCHFEQLLSFLFLMFAKLGKMTCFPGLRTQVPLVNE